MRTEPMYGWRCRIGRITPSSALEGIEEWRRWAPDGVAVMPALMNLGMLDRDDLREMMSQVGRAAGEVAQAQVDVIIQCCAPGTFTQGSDADAKVIENITTLTAIPATTMMSATIDAMRALGMRRIALATAYRDDLNGDLTAFLDHEGFDVAAVVGMNVYDPRTLPFVGPEEAYRTMARAYRESSKVDGVLFSGGGLRTFEVIEAAERYTGVPVVTSGQAGLWKVLRMAGVTDVIPALGKLCVEH